MLLEGVAIFLLAGISLTTLLGVLDRFLLGLGLSWTGELARFGLVWISLISAALAAKHRRHFVVELFVARLGRTTQILVTLTSLAGMLTVLWFGVKLALFFRLQTSPALGISMSWVYGAVPVSATLIAAYLARDLLVLVRPRRQP